MRMSQEECYQTDRRSTWSPEEDERLTRLVSIYGPKNWYLIAKELQTRNGKSCRSRWCNYLAPGIDKGPFRTEEEGLIQEKHKELGNRWSEIAQFLPGRTDMSIKNYWNGHLKRKLMAEGQLRAESPSYQACVTRRDLSMPTGTTPIPQARDADMLPTPPKRARTASSSDLCIQIPDLSAFQNCKAVHHVMLLAALLIQLREDDNPEALCQVIDVAKEFLMRKKAGASTSGTRE